MERAADIWGVWNRRLIILVPYLWLVIFFAMPFLIVFRISLSQTELAQPPYSPVFDVFAGWEAFRTGLSSLSFGNYRTLFSDSLYAWAYAKSLSVAAISTLILLLIGLPIAYGMARVPRWLQPILVTAVILPFWTAFLIRVYAWMTILQREGILNDLLLWMGAISAPVTWLASDTAVYIGIVYSYLPFMVLPLYASFEKMDDTLVEAANDLGCPRWKAFWLVTFPLARPGVLAGALLCFIPIAGEFVIPDLLGGSQSLFIGQLLWTEFFTNKDWPVASALAIVLLAVLLIPILIYQHQQAKTLRQGR